MSEQKKGMLVTVILGLVLILAGSLTLFISAARPHYPAVITGTGDPYTTRQQSGSSSKRIKYNEKVSVVYTDNNGVEKQADGVRVKRSSKSQLPAVGDTIQVAEGLSVHEHSLITPVAVFITGFFVGIALIISGLRYGRKQRRAE